MTETTDTIKPIETPIETMSFEIALDELERLVARLESGQASLEDSISLYERGAKLKAIVMLALKARRCGSIRLLKGQTVSHLNPQSWAKSWNPRSILNNV